MPEESEKRFDDNLYMFKLSVQLPVGTTAPDRMLNVKGAIAEEEVARTRMDKYEYISWMLDRLKLHLFAEMRKYNEPPGD